MRVTFFSGQPRAKKTIVGSLDRFDPEAGGKGQICVSELETERTYEIGLQDIKKARLEPQL